MKKGFTLIELLAVIIILAIVSIIATPIVLDVVSDSKLSANKSNAYSLLDAASLYYTESMFDTTKALKVNAVTDIYNDITVSGNKSTGGKLYVNKKGNTALSVVIDGKCYIKEFTGELEVLDSETCDLGYVGIDEINPILSISTDAITTNDWYKENLYMNIKVTDEEGGSGASSYKYCVDSVECDPNYSVDGDEGSAYITTERINYLCVIGYDKAGNYSNKKCETIKLDKTAPTQGTFNIVGTLGSNGWYTSDVTIEANDGTDSLSGHNSSSVNISSITSNTTGTTIILTTTDVAGNTSNNTTTIKVDKNAPTVTANSEVVSLTKGDSGITSGYFTVSYSISGGNYTCNPENVSSLNAGTQIVSCTATGGNGLITAGNKTIIITYNPYTVTNLVTNSSIENGMEGWTAHYGDDVMVSNEQYKFGQYSAKNNFGDQHAAMVKWSIYSNGIPAIANHQYYFSGWNYTKEKGDGVCYIDFGFTYDSMDHWGYNFIQDNINVWEKFSRINVAPNASSMQISLALADTNSTTKTQECYSDGVMIIDLTATFGAGNEPTKEWCDSHIEYFDGTATIYK